MLIKIPIHIVELEPESFHIVFEAEHRSASMFLLVDTGASKTVFDKSLPEATYEINEKHSKLETHSVGISQGELEVQHILFKSLIINKILFRNVPSVLVDLDHINQVYEQLGKPKISGLIGSDFLIKNKAVIDYDKSLLILDFPIL